MSNVQEFSGDTQDALTSAAMVPGDGGIQGLVAPSPSQFEAPELSRRSETLMSPATAPVTEEKPRGSVKGAKASDKAEGLELEIGKECVELFERFTRENRSASQSCMSNFAESDRWQYVLLGNCLELVSNPLFEIGKFKSYCQANKLTCNKATLKNPFLCVIRATAPSIDNKLASKFAAALQFISTGKQPDQSVADFVKGTKRGIDGCAAEARRAKRAQGEGCATQPRRPLFLTGLPPELEGTVAVVVTITGGKAAYVRPAVGGPNGSAPEMPLPAPEGDTPSGGDEPQHDRASDEAKEVLHQN